MKIFKNTAEIVDYYINLFLDKNITAVDMTVGNGNDIYNIANNVGKESLIYGFDVNLSAIENTKNKLKDIDNIYIKIVNDSHENVLNYINKKINLVIYNLGYLPTGDKSITTDYQTVISSLKMVIKELEINGIIIITFYTGHLSGKLESEEIEKFLINLDQREFNILKYSFINQVNNPPYVVVLEKI